jgi:outer membrane protein assembly factor BamB
MRVSFTTALILLAAIGHFPRACEGDGAAASLAGDWPMFRGSNQRLGTDGTSTLPQTPPVVAWVFTDGKPNFPVTFWSSPFVSRGRLYVGGGVLSPFGTRGYIYCLNPFEIDAITRKPKVIWKHKVRTLVFSSPSLARGIVVCGEGTHTDTGARLYALKATSDRPEGRRIWRFQVPGTVEASPCVVGRSVYFGAGDDFYCLDLDTGRQRWKATIIDVLSSPAFANGMIYVGSGRSGRARPENRHLQGQQLLGLAANTGQIRWRRKLPFPCSSPVTYVDGRLVAGAGKGSFVLRQAGSAGQVICHDAATGRPLWSRSLPGNVLAAIPVQQGLVHVACRNGRYYLLALSDGRLLWEYKCGRALLASPVVSGDRALLVSCRGMAHCVDFKRKTILWKLDLPRAGGLEKTSQVFSSPVLVDGGIYAGLGSRGLICLRPK